MHRFAFHPNGPLAALLLFAALFSPRTSLHAAETSDPPSPPNVIFILCDDLGWGDLGVLHQNGLQARPHFSTPQLDRMAAEGMQLRAHYCPAPVCAPSRASLLTGVHQGHANVRDNQFDKALEENHTLATVLKEAGYRTGLIGKYGLQGEGQNPAQWPAYPTKRGFDEFFGYVRHVDGHLHYPSHTWPLGDSPNHRSPKELWHNDSEISEHLNKCYTTDLFTARAKHWIATQVRERAEAPFFLYLAYDTPHAALQVPTTAYPPGLGLEGGVQWLGEPGKMINTAVGEIDSYRYPEFTGRGWSDAEERFATMVRRIDECVGDLLQTLRDLKIDQNTLVVLSSDNGPHHEAYLKNGQYDPTSFQSYGVFDGTKRDVWEGGIRMPTLVWGPGHVPPGSVNEQPSQSHDWMPTFAELAGVATPARSDGVSLVPTLTGRGTQQDGLVYIEYFNNGRTRQYSDFQPRKRDRKRHQMQVLHLDGYKGVRVDIQSHADPFEIYDLTKDPKELTNLAGSSQAFVDLEQRMRDRVLQVRVRNDSAERPYDDELVPANGPRTSQQGVRVESFQGKFPFVPNLHGKTAGDVTTVASMSEAAQHLRSAGATVLSGWIKVPADGDVAFSMSPSRPAFLRIHEASVVDADFGFEPGQTRRGSVRLAKGLHPYRITCLGGENAELNLKWAVGGEPSSSVPDHAFIVSSAPGSGE